MTRFDSVTPDGYPVGENTFAIASNAVPQGMLSFLFPHPLPPAAPWPAPPAVNPQGVPANPQGVGGDPAKIPGAGGSGAPASARPQGNSLDEYLINARAGMTAAGPAPLQTTEPGARSVAPAALWGRLAPALSDNASMLMALGGGLAGARSWGEGIGKGLGAAAQASLEQQKIDGARRQQAATVSALIQRGTPAHLALAAAQNPQLLRYVLALSRRPGAAGQAVPQAGPSSGR